MLMLEGHSNRRHWEAKALGLEGNKKNHGGCSYFFSSDKRKGEKEEVSLMGQKI